MRRMVIAALVGAMAVTAGASIQIFLTSSGTGLVNPWYAFVPTNGHGTDISDGTWRVNQFPTAMTNATVYVGETVYVWFKYNNEPQGDRILGLDINMVGASDAAWYILDDTLGSYGARRWDGAWTPGAPEFRTPHKVLVSASYGIPNSPISDPGWLYSGLYREYLFGALRYDTPGVYMAGLGWAGINYHGGGAPPTVEFGSVTVLPVPASCRGDANCDGHINFADIDYFVAAIPDNEAAWAALYAAQHGGTPPACQFANNDIDGSGHVDFGDIDPFVALIPSTCP